MDDQLMESEGWRWQIRDVGVLRWHHTRHTVLWWWAKGSCTGDTFVVDPELNEQSLVLRLRSMVSWLSMVVHVKGRTEVKKFN